MITAMTITKDEQINLVADVAGITSKQARIALDTITGLVVVGLLEHARVTLHGLGSFSVQRRSPRRVRNPATGVMMDLPATVAIKFRPTAHVRERVEKAHT